MDQEEKSLREALREEFGAGMNERFGRLIVSRWLWAEAIGLATDPDPRVAFRASWALEWAFFDSPDALATHAELFIDTFLATGNPSAHRHYTKILWHALAQGRVALDPARAEAVAGKCFDILIDPSTRTAVKVWCMEILVTLSGRLDWVREHLAEVIAQQLHGNPSRGMANRGAKILRRIRQD